MINPKDIRILHNYEVNIQYGSLSYAGHIVYLRHPIDGYDKKSFDELDETFKKLIDSKKNVSVVSHSVEILDAKDKIMRWNVCLQQQYQYVALCRNYWLDGTRHYLVDVSHLGTVLCEKAIPSCLLLGTHNRIEYTVINNILNVGVRNPVEMLQEHPLIHSISCFVNDKIKQVLLLYRFAPKFEYVRAIYDMESKTVQFTFNDTEADYLQFESEVASIKDSVDYRRLSLVRELDLFSVAKDAVLAESSKNKELFLRDFEEYLKPIIEI